MDDATIDDRCVPVFIGSPPALLAQLYLSLSFLSLQQHDQSDILLSSAATLSSPLRQNDRNSNHNNDSNDTKFGACFMTKMDNELLYEWLAFHRTVLPLTHFILGSDVNNTHDPSIVLHDMQSLFDYAAVIDASEFANRHEQKPTKPLESPKDAAHHALIHRQKGFMTSCLERLQPLGVHWTLLLDSDEYLVPHAAAKNHPKLKRFNIPSLDSNTTVLDLLRKLDAASSNQPACITVPRLLVGSLENVTCPADQSPSFRGISNDFNQLDTIRFLQHATPGDFSASKFAKVLINLSRINPYIIYSTIPRNIHRPYPSVCGKPIVDVDSSPLMVHHYIGSWERYSGRGAHDARRNRAEWEQRAYVTSTTQALVTCMANMPAWVERFVQLVGGRERAKSLLRVNS
ncbi:hypothetical protein MPSEU_000193800 [Mayamaea pseudoterrestris]|nr:hypothetical protein MPSEU_000193800 [Mayamaea pseudoterrestris]